MLVHIYLEGLEASRKKEPGTKLGCCNDCWVGEKMAGMCAHVHVDESGKSKCFSKVMWFFTWNSDSWTNNLINP